MNRPDYSTQIEGRISNALARASTIRHRAYLIGRHPGTGTPAYQVKSDSHLAVWYTVRVYTSPRNNGGFCYTRRAPHYFLTCDCESFAPANGEHPAYPCKHAARVAQRLERESVRAMRELRRAMKTAPSTSTSTPAPLAGVTLEAMYK
jgi:hypothetical protein